MNDDNRYPYRLSAIRLQNFMAFEDTGWIELRPITLLFGRNSSGKSAIIRALLLLKQSMEGRDPQSPLIFNGRLMDLGSYYNAVHRHDETRDITFGFRVSRPPFDEKLPEQAAGEPDAAFGERKDRYNTRLNDYTQNGLDGQWSLSEGPDVDIDPLQAEMLVTFGRLPDSQTLILKRLVISGRRVPPEGKPVEVVVFSCERPAEGAWRLRSDMPLDYRLEEGQGEERHSVTHPQFSHPFWKKFELDMRNGPVPSRLWVPDRADLFRSDRPPDWQVVDQALEFFHSHISTLLKDMVYLPPLREEPRRYYRVDHEWIRAIKSNPDGWSAVNQWMDSIGLRGQISLSDFGSREGVVSVYVSEHSRNGDVDFNLRDVGSGVSQLLPVVVKSLTGPAEKLVVIEQPELHLHPAAQAELMDLFLQVSRTGAMFVLETHSEAMLLRARLRHAQHTVEARQSGGKPVNALSVLYVERDDCVSRTANLELDAVGRFVDPPPSLAQFFSPDLDDLSKLSDIQFDHVE